MQFFSSAVTILFLVLSYCNQIEAQCTTLNQTTTLSSGSCAPSVVPCTLCPGDQMTLSGSGTNLPAGGCIDWYYSNVPNFNPYAGQGTLMGCSPIPGTPIVPCGSCPILVSIFADACGQEEENEYMVILSGSGFVVDQLSVDFDPSNAVGGGNASIGGGCGWQTPSAAAIASVQTICPGATIVAAGPGTIIPAGQPVFIFTSADFSFAYNWASICPLAPTIYIMQNSCSRTSDAFTNGGAPSTCTTSISLDCGCSSSLSYNSALLSPSNGAFVANTPPPFPPLYGNAGCGLPPVSFPPPPPPTPSTFTFNYTITPAMCNGGPYYAVGIPDPLGANCPQVFTNYLAFDVVCPQASLTTASICANSGLFNLNSLLVSPIAGTWSGPNVTGNQFNPATSSGTQNFTFTPTATCGTPSSTTVTVSAAPTAVISAPTSVCAGGQAMLNIVLTGAVPWTFDLLQNGSTVNTYTVISSPAMISVAIPAASTFTLANLVNTSCLSGTSNSVNVQIATPPTATIAANGPTTVCGGQSTTLEVGFAGGAPIYSFVYAINGVQAGMINTSNNPYLLTVTPSSTSTYTLESVSANGCAGTVSGSVIITSGNTVSGVLTSGSSTICAGQPFNLQYTFTGTGPFTFIPTINGLSQAPIVSPTNTYTQTINPGLGIATYGLESVSANGCTGLGSGFYDLAVVPQPSAALSGDVTSCNPGTPVSLDIDFTGSGPFTFNYTADGVPQTPLVVGAINYNWMVSPSANTTYVLTSVSNSGCTGSVSGIGTVTVDPNPLTGTVSGGGQVCPGGPADTVVFTFTGTGPYTFVYTANNVAQPAITTNNNPYLLFVNPAMGNNYRLQSLTNGVCNGTVSGNTWVLVFTPPTADLIGGGNFCGSANAQVEVNLTGTAPFYVGYSINNVPQPIIFTSDDPYFIPVSTNTNQTFSLDTVYSTGCPGVVDLALANFQIFPVLSYNNLMVNCNLVANTYTVSFTLNGTIPYTLPAGGGSLAGNVYTSNVRSLTNPAYSFTFNDAQGCGPLTISGTANCNCSSNAGTMQLQPLTDCSTDQITAVHNGDQTLDANDAMVYYLHSNQNRPFGTIWAQNASPVFSFQPGMVVGTTYYISAVVGNALPTGVDTTDVCLSVALGTPVRWVNPPTATLAGNYTICPGQSQSMNVALSGSAPYSLTYNANGSPVAVTVNNPNSYTITATLLQNSTYSALTISDQYCTGTANGTAQINVYQVPSFNNLAVDCNQTNITYRVQCTLDGTAPYNVVSGNGSVVGTQFTSDPMPISVTNYDFAITDANQCDTIQLTGVANCACATFAGTMQVNPREDCTQDQITAIHNGDQVLEPNDTLIFFLHSLPAYPFGTIYAQSGNPTFGFLAGMAIGTTYYISAVAGDRTLTGVDTTDQCLSVSVGTPVRWVNPPTAMLFGNFNICPSQSQQLTVNLTGSPSYLLTYSVNGVPITIPTSNSNTFSISTNLIQDGTYQLIAISDQNCVGTATGTATINVHPEPVITNLDVYCSSDNQSYFVEFDVNHDSLSSVTLSGSVNGNYNTQTGHFISAPIPIANSWNAIINDLVWLCGQDSIGGNPPNCNCANSTGQLTTVALNLCNNVAAQVPEVTGSILEPTDTLIYVLSTSLGPPSWSILGVNNSPNFSFNDGLMTPGQTYYILAISGNILLGAGGGIDLGDPCLDIASGPTVVWRPQVTAFLTGTSPNCPSDTAEVVISFTGQAPFTYTYLANGIVQGPFTSATDTARLYLTPSTSVNYSPGTVADATMCQGVFNGGVAISVPLATTLVNQQLNCDPNTQTYTVGFGITNGATPNPVYVATGSAGTITDTTFISDPLPWGSSYSVIITNSSGCSFTVADTPNCQCQADAGTLTTPPISVCFTELVFVQSAGDFSIPTGTDLQYLLVSDTANVPASIIAVSPVPQFTAQPGMVPNQAYYILAVVADTLSNGSIDYTDLCLSLSNAVRVTFRPEPSAILSGTQSICPGGSGSLLVNLTGTAPFIIIYSVNGGNPISIPVSSTTFPVSSSNVLQDQTFNLISVSDALCNGTVSGIGTIDVIDAPQAELLINPVSVCLGQSATLTLNLSGDTAFDIVVSDGTQNFNFNSVQNGETLVVTPTETNTVYTLVSVDPLNNTCTPTIGAPVQLSLTELITAVNIGDYNGFQISCNGATDGNVEVNINNGNAPYLYNWSNGANGSQQSNLAAGPLSVTIADSNGCRDSIALDLLEPEALVANWSIEPPICQNDTDGMLILESISGGVQPWELQFGAANPQAINPNEPLVLSDLAEGSYQVNIIDENGCQIQEDFELIASSGISVNVGADTLIQVGQIVSLNPQITGIVDSFYWSPTIAMADSTKLNTDVSPLNTVEYILNVINDQGCTSEDAILVQVKLDPRVAIPNVIKLGSNDNGVFTISTTVNVKSLSKLSIYDRWGGQVVNLPVLPTDSSIPLWDGRWRGKDVAPGVYVYKVTVEYVNGRTDILTGDITVLR
jgi:hypothetical protein